MNKILTFSSSLFDKLLDLVLSLTKKKTQKNKE